MDDFAYMRLVTNVGVIYVCFGKLPADITNDMLRAITKVARWPRVRLDDMIFEANTVACASMIGSRFFKFGFYEEYNRFYNAKVIEVNPEVLEPKVEEVSSAAMAAVREISRSG